MAGADRSGSGGFYSYEWLEDLAGAQIDNADRIHPEWQHRVVGEIVHLHPATGVEVALFEPGRAVVLKGWGAFVLEPFDEDRTRLLARSRVSGGLGALAYLLLIELPHLIMERKMLLGMKARAEQSSPAQTAGASSSRAS